jgi:hypothetical protein
MRWLPSLSTATVLEKVLETQTAAISSVRAAPLCTRRREP